MSRKVKDVLTNIMTYTFSSLGVIVLLSIIIFVVSKGYKSISLKFITSDYNQTVYSVKITDENKNQVFNNPNIEDVYFSQNWGVGFKEKTSGNGEIAVYVAYVDEKSPLKNMTKTESDNEYVALQKDYIVTKASMTNSNNDYIVGYGKDGAEIMANKFNKATIINNMTIETGGGGIRGSLLTTLLLVFLSLIIALPIGIAGAIYLNEYAPNNKLTNAIRVMIDLIGGVPSIIFGFVGMLIFIPFMDKAIGSDGGSIAAGALTMSIILLPTIIKTTEEALKTIPQAYRSASLALGASKTQTIFKVILPNAVNGILTSVILSISRIIGESAALIYVIGTSIKDTVAINERSTTLSVHIWSIMGGENPNYEQACAIAIIILLIVFLLSILVKIINKKLNKFEVKA